MRFGIQTSSLKGKRSREAAQRITRARFDTGIASRQVQRSGQQTLGGQQAAPTAPTSCSADARSQATQRDQKCSPERTSRGRSPRLRYARRR